ncbi:hypothetical protein Tco_0581176 [Tanacetum coccineum]
MAPRSQLDVSECPVSPYLHLIFGVELVFPSSATVYWQPEKISCVDDFGLKTLNPYGRTKIKVGAINRHDNPRELHFWEYIDAEAEVQQQTVESHGHSELLA